jgi:hypothetical protein
MGGLKYIILEKFTSGQEFAVIFPAALVHSRIAAMHSTDHHRVVSAGFCRLGDRVEAFGGSDTLNLDARPCDAEIIQRDFATADASL